MTLELVIDQLCCPVCRGSFEIAGSALKCAAGHSFDVAREGYVTLLGGGGAKVAGDTAAMLAARAAFLAAGHYLRVADAVGGAVSAPRSMLEIGAGTGYYLAHLLDRHSSATGVGFDISKAAARRIAKAHPRAGAVVADAWRDWPFATGACTHVLSIFAPRNAAEIHRVLVPGGHYIVVTPAADHLIELRSRVNLVGIDEDKAQRLQQTLAGRFELHDSRPVNYCVQLTAAEAVAAVAMGPSGHHLDAQARESLLASLPSRSEVSVAVNIATYRAAITSE